MKQRKYKNRHIQNYNKVHKQVLNEIKIVKEKWLAEKHYRDWNFKEKTRHIQSSQKNKRNGRDI